MYKQTGSAKAREFHPRPEGTGLSRAKAQEPYVTNRHFNAKSHQMVAFKHHLPYTHLLQHTNTNIKTVSPV